MTDELQAETLESEINAIEDDLATAESGAELATAQEEEPEKIDDGAQKAINKQHAKYREEERKRIKIENEANELKEKLKAFEEKQEGIVIPPAPDPYDDDYEEKIAARDAVIMQKANQDAQQRVALDQQNAQQEAMHKAEQERIDSITSSYVDKIKASGLNIDEVTKAGQTVVEYGIDGQLAEFLMQQEDAPFITSYLAKNPVVLDDLRNMSTIEAGLKLTTDIRQAASTLKPQASNAPDPVELLSGNGAIEQGDPLIKGATFT